MIQNYNSGLQEHVTPTDVKHSVFNYSDLVHFAVWCTRRHTEQSTRRDSIGTRAISVVRDGRKSLKLTTVVTKVII